MKLLERRIFERAVANRVKLIAYGFRPEKDSLFLERCLLENSFRVTITINRDGDIDGRVFDLSLGEEYQGFRYEGGGEFAAIVREAYVSLLAGIREKAFDTECFFFCPGKQDRKTYRENILCSAGVPLEEMARVCRLSKYGERQMVRYHHEHR